MISLILNEGLKHFRRTLLIFGCLATLIGGVLTYFGSTISRMNALQARATITQFETMCRVQGRSGFKRVFNETMSCAAMENMREEEDVTYTFQEISMAQLQFTDGSGHSHNPLTPAMMLGFGKRIGDTVTVRYDPARPDVVDAGATGLLLWMGLSLLAAGPLMLSAWWFTSPERAAAADSGSAQRQQIPVRPRNAPAERSAATQRAVSHVPPREVTSQRPAPSGDRLARAVRPKRV